MARGYNIKKEFIREVKNMNGYGLAMAFSAGFAFVKNKENSKIYLLSKDGEKIHPIYINAKEI